MCRELRKEKVRDMKTSETGIKLIKKCEGCRLKAYRCVAGVLTIGYGHTAGVKENDVITKEKAEEYLKQDLEKYEKNVEKYNKTYGWNQNEFDALVSFAYNIGSIDKLTAGGTRSRKDIAEKMLLYNKAGGKATPGLTERRKEEQQLFLTKITPVQISATVQGSGTIRAVQRWINKEYGKWIKNCEACGKELLNEDGEFGAKTKAALTLALQRWINSFGNNIKIDGVFGERTKEACKVVSRNTNANTRGAKIVQAILYCYRYNPQLFTEEFNTDCENALKHYKRDHGLDADGAAGKLFFESALR